MAKEVLVVGPRGSQDWSPQDTGLGQFTEAVKKAVGAVSGQLKKRKAAVEERARAKERAKMEKQLAKQQAGFGGVPSWALMAGVGLAAIVVISMMRTRPAARSRYRARRRLGVGRRR